MKKITLLFSLIVISLFLLANLDGALPGNTNAPGELTCGRAPCHNVPINIGNAQIAIVFGENEMEYFADSTYTIKVKITDPLTTRNGFEILALDENIQNTGTWELTEPDKMKIISGFSDPNKKYVTHLEAGNQQDEWTMRWKAPAGDVGKITFYASVLSANDNGQNTGDEVYNTNISIDFAEPLPTEDTKEKTLKVYPVLSTSGFNVELPMVNEPFHISLLQEDGNVLKEMKVKYGGLHYFEALDFPSGLYFLLIESKSFRSVEKVFIR